MIMKPRVLTYNLKAANNCKLYVVTDIHYETNRIFELTNIIREAIKANPDAIILAGDTINYLDDIKDDISRLDLKYFFKDLRKVAPIYLGIGNHDQMCKDRKFLPAKMPEEQQLFINFCYDLPEITLLHNQKVKIKKGVNLIGLTLPRDVYQLPNSKGTEEPAKKLKAELKKHRKLLSRTRPNETNLLLVHSPRRFTPEVIESLPGIDYIITGHMHQGCVPFGLDEVLPGTRGIIAPGNAPLPVRARHTYPKYSDKLLVLPAYKTFAGWRRHRNILFPQSHTVLKLSRRRPSHS